MVHGSYGGKDQDIRAKLVEGKEKILAFPTKRQRSEMRVGKSMCISEGHGGAGLACGPASAHCIHSKS